MRGLGRLRSGAVALMFTGVSVAATGCGRGGTKTLSHADYIRQADAICGSATTRVNALPLAGQRGTIADVVSFVNQELAIIGPALQQLGALKGPPSDVALLRRDLIASIRTQELQSQTFLAEDQQAKGNATAEQAALNAFANSPQDPNQTAHDKALAGAGFDACAKTHQSS